jgi:hypothetical protein
VAAKSRQPLTGWRRRVFRHRDLIEKERPARSLVLGSRALALLPRNDRRVAARVEASRPPLSPPDFRLRCLVEAPWEARDHQRRVSTADHWVRESRRHPNVGGAPGRPSARGTSGHGTAYRLTSDFAGFAACSMPRNPPPR